MLEMEAGNGGPNRVNKSWKEASSLEDADETIIHTFKVFYTHGILFNMWSVTCKGD